MMRPALFLAGVLLGLLPESAAAQGARVELYADATMTSCELIDDEPALRSLHVFFTGREATGVTFRALIPECWAGAIFLGETWAALIHIGTTQEGAAVAFGACAQPPFRIVEMHMFSAGIAPPCCEYPVGSHSEHPYVWVSCGLVEHMWTPGQSVVINPNATCRCQQPVAVEATTWGHVKSLYR